MMASPQSLWNHKQRCRQSDSLVIGERRKEYDENRRRSDEDILTFTGEEFDGSNKPKSEETMEKLRKHLGYESGIGDKRPASTASHSREKNPKIRALLADAIINGSCGRVSLPTTDNRSPTVDADPPLQRDTHSRLPLATSDMVADVFQKPKVKDSIVSYSDSEEESGDDGEDETTKSVQPTPDELSDIFHDIYKDRTKSCPLPTDVVKARRRKSKKNQRTKAEIVGYDDGDSVIDYPIP